MRAKKSPAKPESLRALATTACDAGRYLDEIEDRPKASIGTGHKAAWEAAAKMYAEALSEFEEAIYPTDILALLDDLDAARQTVSFFASVIRSGESWSEYCDAAYSRAFARSAVAT